MRTLTRVSCSILQHEVMTEKLVSSNITEELNNNIDFRLVLVLTMYITGNKCRPHTAKILPIQLTHRLPWISVIQTKTPV